MGKAKATVDSPLGQLATQAASEQKINAAYERKVADHQQREFATNESLSRVRLHLHDWWIRAAETEASGAAGSSPLPNLIGNSITAELDLIKSFTGLAKKLRDEGIVELIDAIKWPDNQEFDEKYNRNAAEFARLIVRDAIHNNGKAIMEHLRELAAMIRRDGHTDFPQQVFRWVGWRAGVVQVEIQPPEMGTLLWVLRYMRPLPSPEEVATWPKGMRELYTSQTEVAPIQSPARQSRTSTPAVVLQGEGKEVIVNGVPKQPLTHARYVVVSALLRRFPSRPTKGQLESDTGKSDARKLLSDLSKSDNDWGAVLLFPEAYGRGYGIAEAK